LKARIRSGTREYVVDLDRAVSLAEEMSFAGDSPQHFGAPAASSHSLVLPSFSGSVATGASCNCSTITLTPHCNGTHTECVGHLTLQALDAFRVVPLGLMPAMLVTVAPESASVARDTGMPQPRTSDRLITQQPLATAWSAQAPAMSPLRALVIRTRPNPKDTLERKDAVPPYLSSEAVLWIVERGIEHLVVDLPSVDRVEDEGHLSAHRVFFGLPAGVRQLDQARRAQCTITELACVPDAVPDGEYLLELQVPAISGDAVPSRPLLYALEADAS
jgi:kynurenine formamidase